jgi:hypothetical protein
MTILFSVKCDLSRGSRRASDIVLHLFYVKRDLKISNPEIAIFLEI